MCIRDSDKNLDQLTTQLATEMGKVLAEAKGDILKAIEVVECACSSHYLMQGDTCMNVAAGYDTVSFREPLGVFVGIAPYNFPAMIPMGWMLPFCITTGNTFVPVSYTHLDVYKRQSMCTARTCAKPL